MHKKALAIILFTLMFVSTITIFNNNIITSNKTVNELNNPIKLSKPSSVKFYTKELPYTLNILFDEAHAQYFDSNKLSDFLNDLKKEFGATITINSDPFDTIQLNQYDLIILMDPNSNLTKSEITALQDYLENSTGMILVAGTWYKYFEPWTVNFTLKYGLDWYDASTYDQTNNAGANYYPLVHNWANTTVARFLSNNSEFEVAVSGTAIKIVGSNDSTKTIYRIGIGDDDSYLVLENDSELHIGTDINYFVAVDLTSGGRLLAAGSAQMLRNDFYASYDNKPFALRIIHWLLSEGLEISVFNAPSELYVGEEGYVNFTVRNNAAVTATNVQIGIELGAGLGLKNGSSILNIGDLAPGEEKSFSWWINGTQEELSNVTVRVWCDNLPGFSKGAEIDVKVPAVELKVKAEPDKVLLSLRKNFTLRITAYAPRIFDVNNVVINIDLPEGLSTSNSTTIDVGSMSAGESREFKLLINCSTKGVYEITVTSQGDYSEGALKTFITSLNVYVYEFMILFDQGHNQYYDADRMFGLIELLYDWGYVYLNNGTITEANLSAADLVIIPNLEAPLSSEEISLIKQYIDNGGAVIIMGTWYKYLNTSWMNSITLNYGIEWKSGLLIDNVSNLDGNERIPLLSNFDDSIIARILLNDVSSLAFSYSTYLSVSGEAIPIIYGNPTTQVNTSQGFLDLSGEEIIVAAVYENDNGGKILALSSTGLLAYDLDEEDIKFSENIMTWVLGPKIYLDETPPTISINPLETEYINVGEVTVSWNASDNSGIDYFVIYLNEKYIATVDASVSEYTFSNLEDGSYVAKIYAVDIASLYSFDEVVFTVDTQGPLINIISPEPGSEVYVGEITLNFTLSDATGISKVEIYIDGQLNKTIENPGEEVVTQIYIEETGEHTITIIAYDLAGNSNSKMIDITVVERPKAPVGVNIYYILIGAIIIVIAIIGYIVYARRK